MNLVYIWLKYDHILMVNSLEITVLIQGMAALLT